MNVFSPKRENRGFTGLLHRWRQKPRWEKVVWVLLVAAIFAPRFIHIQPFMQNAYRLNMDESYSIKVALGFGTGDLNPHRWIYPTLYTYLLAISYGLVYSAGYIAGVYANLSHFAAQFFIDPRVFMWSGRVLSLIAGVWQILATKEIAARTGGSVASWVAAFGLALSPLHIGASKSAKPDMLAILFATLAVGVLCQLVRRPTLTGYIWAAVFIGLGMGTKYWPAALLIVALGVHLYLLVDRDRNQRPRWWWAVAAAVVIMLVFFITTPYLVLDYEEGLGSFASRVEGYLTGTTERAATEVQHSSAFFQVLPIMIRDGGLPWTALVIVGMGLALKERVPVRMVILTSGLLLVGVFARSDLALASYLLPSFPFLWILAGYGLEHLTSAFSLRPTQQVAMPILIAVLLFHPALQMSKRSLSYCQTDTFTLAERLFHQIAEDGASVYVGRRSLELRNSRAHAIRATQELRWFNGRPGGLPERKRVWQQYLKYANGPWYREPEHSYVVVAKDVLGLSSLPVYMIPMDNLNPIPLKTFADAGIQYIVYSDVKMEQYASRSLPIADFYREVQSQANLVGKVTPENGVEIGTEPGDESANLAGVARQGPTIYIYEVPGVDAHTQLRLLLIPPESESAR